MKQIELLAPAGNMDCLKAAVQAGCDAVYLGGYLFGARNFAGNFSMEELAEAVRYAHLYGVKVYVTVNTIIYEAEVPTFLAYIEQLITCNVDAYIIQDIGMLDLLHQRYPDIELHASTQMHLHNLEGVQLAQMLGVKRAVLAREVDINTIRKIRKQTTCALEVFVHGALCISYSGQCLMSSLIGGRSGNRGTCAGTCRQKYRLIKEKQGQLIPVTEAAYLLSTKDLNTLEYVGQLIDAGVDSLKIEGRMKRPSYVYTVVRLYRQAIDSYLAMGKVEIPHSEIEALKRIFHRESTKGFLFLEENQNLTNPYRPNHLGVPVGKVIAVAKDVVTIALSDTVRIHDGIRILGAEDTGCELNVFRRNHQIVKEAHRGETITLKLPGKVTVDSPVVLTTDARLLEQIDCDIQQEKRKVKITGHFTGQLGVPLKLTVCDGDNEIEITGSLGLKAEKIAITKDEIRKRLQKLGDTVYCFEQLTIKIDDGLFIPVKELNHLRREAIEQLNEKRLYRCASSRGTYFRKVATFPSCQERSIFVPNLSFYERIKLLDYDRIYVPATIYDQIKTDSRVMLKLPRVMNTYPCLSGSFLIGELGSVNRYPNSISDFSFNVVNSYSVALLHALQVSVVTLSYELNDQQIVELLQAYRQRYQAEPNLELIVYAKEEIMVSKFILPKKYQQTDEITYLEDRFGNLYPIRIIDDLMYIYNYHPRHFKDEQHYYDLGIHVLRTQLLDELDFIEVQKNT